MAYASEYLQGLDMYVWTRVTSLVELGFDVCEVIHVTFKATVISCAYSWFMVFRQLLFRPLSLTQGDIAANIEALLLVLAASLDDASARIQRSILQHGVQQEYIERSLKLLAKAPCSVNVVEQSHGVGAVIMKLHDQYHELMLRTIALLCSAKSHVLPSKLDQQLVRLNTQIDRLTKSLRTDLHAKNMFAKSEGAYIRASVDIAGLTVSEAWKKWNIHLSNVYDALPVAQRRRYEMAASEASRIRKHDIQSDIESLRNLVELHKQRAASDLAEFGTGNHLSDVRWSASDMAKVCAHFNALNGKLKALKDRRLEAPDAISAEEIHMLEDIAASLMQQKPERAEWLSCVCDHRGALENTVCYMDSEPSVGWAMLYASQNPKYAIFLRLERRDVVLPAFEHMTASEVLEADWDHRREYRYPRPVALACDELVPFKGHCEFNVLYGLRFCTWGV